MSKTYSLTFGEYKKIVEELKLGKITNIVRKVVPVHAPGQADDAVTNEQATELWIERNGKTLQYLLTDLGLVNSYLVNGTISGRNDPYEYFRLCFGSSTPILLFMKDVEAKAKSFGLDYVQNEKRILQNYYLEISKMYFWAQQKINGTRPIIEGLGSYFTSEKDRYELDRSVEESAKLAEYLSNIGAILTRLSSLESSLKAKNENQEERQ